jgi:hypothetical protein
MSAPSSHHLRQRAAVLRRIAREIERTPIFQLDQLAGIDTWRGPVADECRHLLAADLHALHGVVDDLRLSAWRLDEAATVADAARLAQLAR